MKNFKMIRKLWIFIGLCNLVSIILYLSKSIHTIVAIITGVTSILSFFNAYMYHKKLTKDDQEIDSESV